MAGFLSENHIYWETASQFDFAGFNIRRSEGKELPGKIMNESLIEVQGSRIAGNSYDYIDSNIKFWKRYNYSIEIVKLDGKIEIFDEITTQPNFGVISMITLSLVAGAILILKNIPDKVNHSHEISEAGH